MTHYSARDRSKPTPGHVENQAWTTMPIDGATRESVSAFLMFFESRARADTTSTSMSPGSPSWTMALEVRTHKPNYRTVLRLSSRMLATGGNSSWWLQRDLADTIW